MRRAASHLKAGHLAEPLKDVDAEDRDLVGLLAELTVEAGRWPVSARSTKPPMLEVQQFSCSSRGSTGASTPRAQRVSVR